MQSAEKDVKCRLEKLPQDIRRIIKLAQEVSARRKVPAYLVGGFVRDFFLRAKNLDVDIVLESDGAGFAGEFARSSGGRLVTHSCFQTATVYAQNNRKIDFSTARKEVYLKPAALPQVETGSLADDLYRRDFTINAMALNISKGNFGRLVDLYGGRQDLKDKRIRVMHRDSFVDDPTRILRAVRFQQRYDFTIERETLKCLNESLEKRMLERTQPQRLRRELILLLKEKSPFLQAKRLHQAVGLSFIHPGLGFSSRTAGFFKRIEQRIQWYGRLFCRRRPLETWLLYFTALLEPASESAAKLICQKFVFNQGQTKRIIEYKHNGGKVFSALKERGIKPSLVYKVLEPLSYEGVILLCAKFPNPVLLGYIRDFFLKYNGTRACISGQDLLALGFVPGPLYQKLLSKVLAAKLDGKLKSRADEIAYIRNQKI